MYLRRFGDVVAFDQRGTGASEPAGMLCAHEDGVPLDRPGSPERFLAVLRPEVRRCLGQAEAAGTIVSGLTTRQSADDVEALREALGAPRLSLLGASYGTHLALAVARYHPESVDRMVLAGVEGPDQTIKLPSAIDANLDDLGQVVARDSIYRDLIPDLRGELQSLVSDLDRHPRELEVLPGVEVTVGGWDLRRFVAEMIGRRFDLERLPRLVYAMERGNFSELARWSYRARQPGATHLMNLAMDCASYASPTRLRRIRSEAEATVLGATADFPLPGVCDVAGLPRLGSRFRAPLHRMVPALLVSGSLDGRTPIANARRIAAELPNATMLTIDNATHGRELLMGSPRIRERVGAFLSGRGVSVEQIRLPTWTFEAPIERSLPSDVLAHLASTGFEGTVDWYRRMLAEHSDDGTYDFDSSVLNRLGYDLLAADEVALAIQVFRLNTIGHPEASNPWDSLGEGYLAAGEQEKAIAAYRRSLLLNPANDNARRVLEDLESSP
jgi:pimeloyl-ACP methyl ester carboxylesterase